MADIVSSGEWFNGDSKLDEMILPKLLRLKKKTSPQSRRLEKVKTFSEEKNEHFPSFYG